LEGPVDKLREVVQSLSRGQMGAEGPADRKNTELELLSFSDSQNRKGYLLVGVLVLLLILPVVITQLKVPEALYPYLMGGAGIFTAGTFKLILDAFRDVSRAQTLVIICKNLESVDAKEVMTAWLKG
jgi:hypothetical protein